MAATDDDEQLRSAGVPHAQSIDAAKRRAEEQLVLSQAALQRVTEELREQKDWLRVTLGSIGDAVVTVDTSSRITFLNPTAESLTGWTAAEALDRDFHEVLRLIDESTERPVPSPIDEVLSTGTALQMTAQTLLARPDGTRLPIDDSAAPIRTQTGDLLGVVMVFRDVSERRAREQELARSEERFRVLSTVAPHLLWSTNAQGGVEYFNERWYDYTGQAVDEALGDGWMSVLHPDDRDTTLIAWRSSVAEEKSCELEYRLRRHDGEYHWFVARGVPVRDERGAVVRWVGSCTDIHQRRLAVEAMREASTMTEELFKVAQALVSEHDLAKIVQLITDVCTRLTRAQFGAFFYNTVNAEGDAYMLYALSGAPKEAFSKFPMPRATAIFAPTFRGGSVIRLGDVRRDSRFGRNAPYHGMPPGHLPVVSYLAAPVVSRTGEVFGGLFFGHGEPDVFTERDERMVTALAAQAAAAMDSSRLFQREQQARAAAEAANRAKDRFLAMLSHELRTPLTPVLMTAAELEGISDLPAPLRHDMAMIRRNVELEAKLIDDLLDISRVVNGKLSLDTQVIDVNVKVMHVCATCSARAREKGVNIRTEVEQDRCEIVADAGRVQQVLWNLVTNAVKFTPAGGSVVVSTRRVGESDIELKVKDTGIGIEAATLPSIFDAFVQGPGSGAATREYGGLGLGLAISKAIVEAHHGTIRAESAGLGAGAVFTVTLPVGDLAPRRAGNQKRTDATVPSDAIPVRILLVEDHEDTARALGELLRRAGYRVRLARDVAGALQLLKSENVDIVVSDLGLPDGTGLDLIRLIREFSDVPAIAMSGYGMEEDIVKSRKAGFTAHLVKPMKIPMLQHAIAQALRQTAGGTS